MTEANCCKVEYVSVIDGLNRTHPAAYARSSEAHCGAEARNFKTKKIQKCTYLAAVTLCLTEGRKFKSWIGTRMERLADGTLGDSIGSPFITTVSDINGEWIEVTHD